MKLQFEKIVPQDGYSFKVFRHTEADPCHVFWHYHPEYELLYLPDGWGRRHIGTHIGTYQNGELVFIGPNVPHLNYSYGRGEGHAEVVIQLGEHFMGEAFLQRPELQPIRQLFRRATQGLVFGETSRKVVGDALWQLPERPPLERLLALLQILATLATAADAQPLHSEGTRFDLNPKEQIRLDRVSLYVETHYQEPIDIRAVAALANLTVPAFCRYFKRMTHLTFTDFVNEYRVGQAQKLLHSARTISDVGSAVGFSNVSHFNKTFRQLTGQTPGHYRKAIRMG